MSAFTYLRKLLLGETWVLPAGLTVAFAAAVLVREVAGTDGWWESSGGFVLLGLVLAALVASLRIR